MRAEDFKFQEGDRIVAVVEEVISPLDLIVSYYGSLFRVRNTSGSRFSKGAELDLVVVRREPLELQLYSVYRQKNERFA